MRRHVQLQPLSRAHHQTLRLARDLQRADSDPASLRRALDGHRPEMMAHFVEEETSFGILVQGVPSEHAVHRLLLRMQSEHRSISAALDTLTEAPCAARQDNFQSLGRMLAEHVAFEERVLFPSLEECCLPEGDTGRESAVRA